MSDIFNQVINYIKTTGYNPYSDDKINKSDIFYIDTLNHHYSSLSKELEFVTSNHDVDSVLELGSYLSVGAHIARGLNVPNVSASDMYELSDDSNYKKWLSKKNIMYEHYDLTKEPTDDHSDKYDCIIFQETLEHIPHNPVRTLINVNKMLKTNGILIFSVPNFFSLRSMINILKTSHPYVKEEEFLDIGSTTEKSGVHWIEFNTKLIKRLVDFSNYETITYHKNNINYGSKKNYVLKNIFRTILPFVFDQHRFILKKARPFSEYISSRKKVHAEHEAMNL